MAAPNMATITASLERSLQNCSLNNHHQQQQSTSSRSTVENSSGNQRPNSADADASLELNSEISLPYHWEQCLDLKTGEIYYINWRTGMKAKEDPRTTVEYGGDFYSDNDDDDTSYDSDGSSSESSPCCSSSARNGQNVKEEDDEEEHEKEVLVVTGCKSCLMYFMVAKQVADCPKCCGQLLHFDRSENGSDSP